MNAPFKSRKSQRWMRLDVLSNHLLLAPQKYGILFLRPYRTTPRQNVYRRDARRKRITFAHRLSPTSISSSATIKKGYVTNVTSCKIARIPVTSGPSLKVASVSVANVSSPEVAKLPVPSRKCPKSQRDYLDASLP